MLRLHFLGLQVDDLPQLVHTVTPCQHLTQDLTRHLLQLVLQCLLRHIRWLRVLLVEIRFVAQLGEPGCALVLTLLF